MYLNVNSWNYLVIAALVVPFLFYKAYEGYTIEKEERVEEISENETLNDNILNIENDENDFIQ